MLDFWGIYNFFFLSEFVLKAMGFMGYIFDTTPKFLPSLLVSQKQSSTIPKTLQNILTHKRKTKNTIFLLIKTMGSNSRTLKEMRITNSQLSYTKICQKLYWNLKKRVYFIFFYLFIFFTQWLLWNFKIFASVRTVSKYNWTRTRSNPQGLVWT